jgi:hypothetical protein
MTRLQTESDTNSSTLSLIATARAALAACSRHQAHRPTVDGSCTVCPVPEIFPSCPQPHDACTCLYSTFSPSCHRRTQRACTCHYCTGNTGAQGSCTCRRNMARQAPADGRCALPVFSPWCHRRPQRKQCSRLLEWQHRQLHLKDQHGQNTHNCSRWTLCPICFLSLLSHALTTLSILSTITDLS